MYKEKLEKFWKEAILRNIPYNGDKELAFYTYEEASATVSNLLKENYAVMLTMEEDLFIVSFIETYTDNFARNEVAFFHRDYLEDYPQAIMEYYKDDE